MYTVYNNNLSVHVSVTSNIIKIKPNRQEKVKLFVQTASKDYLNLILNEIEDMEYWEYWEQRSLGFL